MNIAQYRVPHYTIQSATLYTGPSTSQALALVPLGQALPNSGVTTRPSTSQAQALAALGQILAKHIGQILAKHIGQALIAKH